MLETKNAGFTYRKQGIYHFSRRVPSDLTHHYTAERICCSLRTKSAVVANSRAQRAAQQLDEHWYHLRIRDADLPGKHLLRMAVAASSRTSSFQQLGPEASVKLSDGDDVASRMPGSWRVFAG
jgi:hypothetical protein